MKYSLDDLFKLIHAITESGVPDASFSDLLVKYELDKLSKEELIDLIKGNELIKTDNLSYPLDNINHELWKLLSTPTGKQLSVITGKTPNHIVYYQLDFDDSITFSKTLSQFDKRICCAIASLYNEGNTIVTLNQIYKVATGTNTTPNSNQRKKVYDALSKMRKTSIYIDTKFEGLNYPNQEIVYDGSVISFDRVTSKINGGISDAAIRILSEPPLIKFARDRNQITTIDIKYLGTPINHTELSLAIEDYLIQRISHAKRGNSPKKILLKTLYQNIGISENKDKKHKAYQKLDPILSHYQKTGFISGYKITDEYIEITLDKSQPTLDKSQLPLDKSQPPESANP